MANSSAPPTPPPWQPPGLLRMAGPSDSARGPGGRPSPPGALRLEDRPQRILVVEDDPGILGVWRRLLGPRRPPPGAGPPGDEAPGGAHPPGDPGFTIDTATQGLEGYKKVIAALEESRPYTFALVDMRMPPGWDGLETLLHMVEKDPKLEVAICSAFSDISRDEVAQRVGRSDLLWLRKPFEFELAREVVRKLSAQGLRRRQGR